MGPVLSPWRFPTPSASSRVTLASMKRVVRVLVLCSFSACPLLACGSDEGVAADDDSQSDDTADDADDSADDAAPDDTVDDTPNLPTDGSNEPTEDNILVGMWCESDADCLNGMTCLTDGSFFFPEGGNIAQGMCTARCEAEAPEFCPTLDIQSACFINPGEEGEADDVGYCLDACVAGSETVCHGLPDRWCAALEADGSGLCAPQCFNDATCGDQVCDGASGACIDEPRPGEPLGAVCGDSAECNGQICYLSEPDGEQGLCSEYCVLSPYFGNCGGSPEDEVPEFLCWPSIDQLASETGPAYGDLGLCSRTCDSDEDCGLEGFSCIEFAEELAADVGRLGLCQQTIFFEDPDNMGGAGGADMGGAGGTDDGGAGGAMAGSGGEQAGGAGAGGAGGSP